MRPSYSESEPNEQVESEKSEHRHVDGLDPEGKLKELLHKMHHIKQEARNHESREVSKLRMLQSLKEGF